MDPKYAAGQVRLSREFFCRTIECLTEEDSDFTPVEGIYSVAHHVAHAAFTVDWFIEGAFRPEGFDMDEDLDLWIDRALAFNKFAKKSKKRR